MMTYTDATVRSGDILDTYYTRSHHQDAEVVRGQQYKIIEDVPAEMLMTERFVKTNSGMFGGEHIPAYTTYGTPIELYIVRDGCSGKIVLDQDTNKYVVEFW